ncbi:30S ribosome-binding factor RbfA [Neomoorella thermoacetica]|uniref:Ribosome-binding factor A n=1 Tax=Moorella thermoacetica Y72 TaxID=1325331 RepID=A0A0S6UIJ3_NEOTH|nr:30S ribosome-binding factor RbfA [Moorella thermoacetica]GAF26795.1 ribosome-binding factor A [Moorella thermoacetica Y72]
MAVTARNQRVAEEMKKEIARIIRDEVKDPRLEAGLVSVTGVELSNDRHYAKVYVSIYGDEEAKNQAMEGLARATSFIRREIGQRLSLRYTPEITFKLDVSIEHGDHINRLLARVRAGEYADE